MAMDITHREHDVDPEGWENFSRVWTRPVLEGYKGAMKNNKCALFGPGFSSDNAGDGPHYIVMKQLWNE